MGKAKQRQSIHKRADIKQKLAEGKAMSAIFKETGYSYAYVKMIVGQERQSTGD